MSSNLKLRPNQRKRKQNENLLEVVIKINRCDAPKPVSLLILPSNVLNHILTFCTFHEIARLREVCRPLNDLCKAALNKESERICEEARLIYTKSQIKLPGNLKLNPPKFSNHRIMIEAICDCLTVPLYRYRPHINNNKGCFIAGKVLDLIREQLMIVKSERPNMKKFEVLNKETKRCAVAAITHFVRVVIPLIQIQALKSRHANLRRTHPDVGSQTLSKTLRVVPPALSRTERVLLNERVVKTILETSPEENSQNKEENKLKDNNEAFEEQKKLVKKQAKKIRLHEKLLEYQAKKIKDLNKSLSEVKANFNKQMYEMNHRLECLEKDSKSRVELVLLE